MICAFASSGRVGCGTSGELSSLGEEIGELRCCRSEYCLRVVGLWGQVCLGEVCFYTVLSSIRYGFSLPFMLKYLSSTSRKSSSVNSSSHIAPANLTASALDFMIDGGMLTS